MPNKIYVSTLGLNEREKFMLNTAIKGITHHTLELTDDKENADIMFLDQTYSATSDNNLAKYIICIGGKGEKPKPNMTIRGRIIADALARPLRANDLLTCLEKLLVKFPK